MIGALTVLLVFQLIGEAFARGLDLPIPGPVIGMGLMFAVLVMRGGPGGDLRSTATGILQHLSLLFIPAGTGVMLHFQRLADEWLPLTVALIASTLLSIGVSALLLHLLSRRTPHGEDRS
ncbi:CidA/LrgA family protein [Aromatoleum evansii]|uniref:CidA/LrgA family protein n=1 Tax=Aromatoleum evansii TaxID=59406 RepID=UPI00145F4FA4|nr:CidA/LrgA family protein [Aromatoleum evansii]NMG29914.1 CidA/LrgA family protein [Aromatoleum evansii]